MRSHSEDQKEKKKLALFNDYIDYMNESDYKFGQVHDFMTFEKLFQRRK